MSTNIGARYEIGDERCGLIEYARTENVARRLLDHYSFTHHDCRVTLYDRMAHQGHPEKWDGAGRVLSRRATPSRSKTQYAS